MKHSEVIDRLDQLTEKITSARDAAQVIESSLTERAQPQELIAHDLSAVRVALDDAHTFAVETRHGIANAAQRSEPAPRTRTATRSAKEVTKPARKKR